MDANGYPSYWWGALAAVPPRRDSLAYQRLRRVWLDRSRLCGTRLEDRKAEVGFKYQNRHHEFVKPTHETNLTATLWENFTLFPCQTWLPRLYAAAGLAEPAKRVNRCAWSYEWIGKVPGSNRSPMCDIVVEHEGGDGERGMLVVEAKALGKCLGEKDTNPAYYLEIAEVAAVGEKAAFLYLVDEACRERVLAQVETLPSGTGLLTWQQLGGLQIGLAAEMAADEPVRAFIAGAIQCQFVQHNIIPTRLAAEYLAAEPSMEQVDLGTALERLPGEDHCRPFWRLP